MDIAYCVERMCAFAVPVHSMREIICKVRDVLVCVVSRVFGHTPADARQRIRYGAHLVTNSLDLIKHIEMLCIRKNLIYSLCLDAGLILSGLWSILFWVIVHSFLN